MDFDNGQPVTTQDIMRILGIGDEFLDDWETSAEEGGDEDDKAQVAERKGEWRVILPLLEHSLDLFMCLKDLLQTTGSEAWEAGTIGAKLRDKCKVTMAKAEGKHGAGVPSLPPHTVKHIRAALKLLNDPDSANDDCMDESRSTFEHILTLIGEQSEDE